MAGKRSCTGKLFSVFIFLFIMAGGYFAYEYFIEKVYGPNIKLQRGVTKEYLYIPTGYRYDQVLARVEEQGFLKDPSSFDWLARRMNYPQRVYPGKYPVKPNMNNRQLIKMLRAGEQEAVMLRINRVDYMHELADLIDNHLEASAEEFLQVVNDSEFLSEIGFTPSSIFGMFIANTYEFKWNTNPRQFLQRMKREYDRFWTDERLQKASALGFTPYEIATLAAIVQAEATKRDEMPKIAGVYLNRLRINMPLQADPTVRYALGDKNGQRVYNNQLQVDNPYNTYRNTGLPPGPITIPQTDVLDAVLNAEKHRYLYFVAKDDLSGYHHFSRTFEEHRQHAQRYRAALNRRNIR